MQLSPVHLTDEHADGYAPNLGANVFFTVIFALSSVTFLAQGFRWRGWWGFTAATTLGTALEAIGKATLRKRQQFVQQLTYKSGYIARILLWQNPFSNAGFDMNVVLLTFAPAFFSAGIYLLLKQFCLVFGPQFSRLRPQLYSYIFISCDVLSIILQCAGGALSATASDGDNLLTIGENIMIAGLAFQVFTLLIFAILAGDVFYSMYKHRYELPAHTSSLRASRKFRFFVGATVFTFLCIFIRCCYRIAELQGGWGSTIMRNETEFIILESVYVLHLALVLSCARPANVINSMITLAALAFNIFHPGYCFKRPVAENGATFLRQTGKVSDAESETELTTRLPTSHVV